MPNSVTEFFNGGLVTNRHPALLREGELQRADDCIYRDNDPAIWRAPGRWNQTNSNIESYTVGATTYAHPIKSMTHLTFDNKESDQIIAYVNQSWYRADISAINTSSTSSYLSFSKVTSAGIIEGDISASRSNWTTIAGLGGMTDYYWTFTLNDPTIVLDEQIIGATCRVCDRPSNGTSLTVVDVKPASGGTGAKIALSNHPTYIGLDPNSATVPSDLVAVTGLKLFFTWGVPLLFSNNSYTETDPTKKYEAEVSEKFTSLFHGSSYIFLTGAAPYRLEFRNRNGRTPVLVARPLSLSPVTERPIVTISSRTIDGQTPSWPDPPGLGVYWVLLTEILDVPDASGTSKSEVESGYLGAKTDVQNIAAGDPISIYINSVQTSLEIITPPPVNKGGTGRYSTHWGVYLGGPQNTSAVVPSLATFRRVGKFAITDFTESSTSVSVATFSTIANSAVITVADSDRSLLSIGARLISSGKFSTNTVIKSIGARGSGGTNLTSVTLDRNALTTSTNFTGSVQTGGQLLVVANLDGDPVSGGGYYSPTVVTSGASEFPTLFPSPKFGEWKNKIYFTSTKTDWQTATEYQAKQWPPFHPPRAVSGTIASTSGGDKDAVNFLSGWKLNGTGASLDLTGQTVAGIKFYISGSAVGEAGLHVQPSFQYQLGNLSPQMIFSGRTEQKILGSQTDTWALGLPKNPPSPSTAIKLAVMKLGTGSPQTIVCHNIKMQVTTSSGSINFNGVPYRVVTYRDQAGITINDPANLPPPNCSTGDFYQGSLVLNDTKNPSMIRYSLPGTAESFPKPYYINFNSNKNDIVTYIGRVGSALIVGFSDSIKRVNYLPKETDTDLQSGLSHEDITVSHGIIAPNAAAKFDLPAEGPCLAYVNNSGIYLTNGSTTRPLSLDLDWPNTVKISALSSCRLIANKKEKWIAFYYCPAGASHNKNTRVLYFFYQSDKIKAGSTLPVLGPSKVSARSVCEVNIQNNHYIFTGHDSDGRIYCEDNGIVNPSSYKVYNTAGVAASSTITPVIRTRRIYHAGYNRDARIEQLLLLYSPFGTTTSLVCLGSINDTTVGVPNGSTVSIGTRVSGHGIRPGTIITGVLTTNDSYGIGYRTVFINNPVTATFNGELIFDTGCLGITVRGAYTNSVSTGTQVEYVSTTSGDLLSCHADHIRQGMELEFSQLPYVFDSDLNSVSYMDISTNMRLHHYTTIISDEGGATNRTAV